MRLWLLFLPLPILAALAGCPSPPELPDLGPPPKDCAKRPPARLELGTGANQLVAPDGGLVVEQGVQGGNHIWITVQTHNLGPLVLITPEVRDARTGAVLSATNLAEVEELTLEADGGVDPLTVEGVLAVDPPTIFGTTVTLSATVSDACPHAASGKATGLVKGYDPGQ
jgi:hypothetical protein